MITKFNISMRTAAIGEKLRKINGVKPAEKYKDKDEMIIDEKKKLKGFYRLNGEKEQNILLFKEKT